MSELYCPRRRVCSRCLPQRGSLQQTIASMSISWHTLATAGQYYAIPSIYGTIRLTSSAPNIRVAH